MSDKPSADGCEQMALRARNSWRSGRHPAGATSGRSTRGIRVSVGRGYLRK